MTDNNQQLDKWKFAGVSLRRGEQIRRSELAQGSVFTTAIGADSPVRVLVPAAGSESGTQGTFGTELGLDDSTWSDGFAEPVATTLAKAWGTRFSLKIPRSGDRGYTLRERSR